MNITFQPNTLYYGDCLDIMNNFPDGCIDLICLDPPFNSKRQYNQIFRNSGLTNDVQIKAFDDTWTWDEVSAERVKRIKRASANPASKVIAGFELHIPRSEMLSYTSYMAERLFVMHRILKDTGSIYLHCDPTASHFLKLVMDAIFGRENIRNEIVWCYTGPGSPHMRQFNRKHDTIFWYSKGKKWTFNIDDMRVPYKDPNQTLRRAMDAGRGMEDDEIQRYRNRGKVLESYWTDIALAVRSPNERLGYPTQKPLKLYERIIQASSNPDDLVLDPFAGCGTTIEAALKNDRRVIGIDILPFALHLINNYRVAAYSQKLRDPENLLPIIGIPVDFETATSLAKSDPFKFQDWAVSLIHGFAANPKKVGDDGIDGFGMLLNKPDNMDKQGIIVQVTGARGSQKAKYDRLKANVTDENAAMGILITLDAQPASRNWMNRLDRVMMGETSYPAIQCFSIKEYFDPLIRSDMLLKLPPLANPWTGKAMPAVQIELL